METAKGEGQKLVPLLKRLLNENSVPQLCWVDKEQAIWKLPWRIHKQTVWGNPDALMLLEIAKCLYGHTGEGEPEKGKLKHWKELLRNALRSLKKDVKELENLHMQDGDNPYKVYQFLKNDHKGVRKGQQKKTTDLRGTNGDSDRKGQRELPTTCGFSPGFASSSESSFQFSENSQNIQASTNLAVPFNVSQQFFTARNSAFQHYNQISDVPTPLLNDLNHATVSPRYHILSSTSCSIDDHPAATGPNANARPLEQLVSGLNIFDECIPRIGENTFRSRSPLSNGYENMGNIPLILEDATEVENDETDIYFVTQVSNLDRYQQNIGPHQRNTVPHQRIIGSKQGNYEAPQHNILSQSDNLVLQQGNVMLQQSNFVLPDGNFGLYQENIVSHQRYIAAQKGNIGPKEGNYVLQDGNTMSREENMVTQTVCPATYINNTTVLGGSTVATNSSSQSSSRSRVIAGGSFLREHPLVAPNMLNLWSRLNIPQILNLAPRQSLVVIAYYYSTEPVKIQYMTGKFRICFVADDDARESIRNCPSPQQFGPNDVEMFELPEVDEVSKRKAEARDTQKVLNNLSRGIIIDYRSEDIYATRYCKAVPQFCNPETTQFTKMERQQEVKIFDFQNTLSLSRDPSFQYQISKPYARLVFAVKDANTRQSVLTVDIWHKEAYQMTQAVAENGSSMEADCSMSDEYDLRMSIEQKLKNNSLSFYTSRLLL